MRYYKFAIERVASGAIVSHAEIPGVRTRSLAVRAAREATARLSSRQAQSSVVRLLGWQSHDNPLPVAAFRKHPKSGRVTRV